MAPAPADGLRLEWSHGDAFARLDVSLTEMRATVTCSGEGIESWPW
jgi:hypothetical protein